ncbi:MAG: amidohydrolase family protein [Parvularculaceae bacterium]|nr:amidohydrolase family protein [Parvularculaceae bacterium]
MKAVASAAAAALVLAEAASAETIVIRAGRLVDVDRGIVRTDQAIVVEGERITSVGPAAATQIPDGARVVDLSAYVVLPGLVDTHTHLTSDPTISYLDSYHLSAPRFAVLGVANARRTLLAGVTTARNVGAPFYADVALRDGIDRGEVMGPRVFAAGAMLSMTGGHGDDNHLAPFYGWKEEGVADGVDAVREAVREHVKYGADLIKFATSGGVFSANTQPGMAHYSQDEANMIVATAHALGKTVAVHAHGAEGIKTAIRAGADSVEHASLVDDEGIRMAAKAGTVFSMDIYNTDYTQAEGLKNGVPAYNIAKDKAIGDTQRDNFRKALKAKVKLSFGTDSGVYPHGDNAKQLAVMVRYGMTPMQAIVAATKTGADLLKLGQDIGALRAGAYADIIAVKADPLADVAALERVAFVMKGGEVYRGAPEQCAAAPSSWPCEPPAP